MNNSKFYICILIVSLISGVSFSYSQNKNTSPILNDTLTLNDVIKEVIQNHPSVKQIEETINEAEVKTNLAKTGNYPNLEFNASYTRLGPVSFMKLGPSTFELYPADNYSTSLTISENILDFGRTSKNVNYQNENKVLAAQKLQQVKQSLALTTINCYVAIMYLQEAVEIKNKQLFDLEKHLDFINKKNETGSAIRYEILTTQVRISAVESQKTDLESYLKIQQSVLNSLLGKPVYSSNNIKVDTLTANIGIQNDSLVSYAVEHRIELEISREKSTLAELNYKLTKTQNYPVINIFATGSWKNGLFPEMKVMTANFAAGIGITIPVLDFGRNNNHLLLSKSAIIENDFETQTLKRKIESEVVECIENLKASQKKINQFELQLNQTREAYSLAEINFKNGAIINLDLLDASTNVSESSLLLLKSKMDYILNTYKLKSAIGINLY